MARGSTVARGASGGAGSVSTSSSWRTGASRRTGTSGSTDSNAGNVSTASNRVASTCHRWANDGKCRFGESCRFAHDPAARATGAVPGATPTSSSRPIGASDRAGGGGGSSNRSIAGHGGSRADCQRFMQQLKVSRPGRLELLIKGSEDLWQKCWEQACGGFDMKQLEALATALAMVPFSAMIPPPPLHVWQAAMCSYLQKAEKSNTEPKDGMGPKEILFAVEVVLNASKKLLEFEWEEEQTVVKEALETVLGEASDSLKNKFKDHRATRKLVDSLIDQLEKPWIIKNRSLADNGVGSVSDPGGTGGPTDSDPDGKPRFHHSKWRAPTIEWLRQPQLFTPALLPKMEVPSSKSHGVYQSKEHYHDTLERVMIGMTFSDGHAALMPRCFEATPGRGGGCGNTLLPVHGQKADSTSSGTSGGQLCCRSKSCDRIVEVACPIRAHTRGLCARCGDREKKQLLAQAGPHASTHVYDGRVHRIDDVDGKLFIENFESRQPPRERPIHWRSTSRLQAPNLVGVVHLGPGLGSDQIAKKRGRALEAIDLIMWAEITNHPLAPGVFSKGNVEGTFREKGKLCLNMLSVTGSFDPDRFALGDEVAIIDCMTFVPEFVPVIRALEQQKVQTLPFDDGGRLNLWGSRPVNTASTISETRQKASHRVPQVHSFAPTAELVETLVDDMISDSMLQPIREIRQNVKLSGQLRRDLVQLVLTTTLDKGQLVNFIDALRSDVHLTQGPPGTGKSYLGVVLIRALHMIKQSWQKQNPSIGQRPILVLSYKQHATDEIGADYIDSLSGPSNSHGVIRLGNSQHPRLQPYLERTCRNRDLGVTTHRKVLERLRDAGKACAKLCTFAQLFSSYRQDMFGQDGTNDEKQQKQRERAAYDATEVMLACIVRAELLSQAYDGDSDADAVAKSAIAILLLDDDLDGGKCRQTQKKMDRQEKFAELSKMHHGFEHYIDGNPHAYGDPAEMLFQWLKGVRPLPKCTWSDHDNGNADEVCHELAFSHDVPLCNEHRCHMPLGADNTSRCDNALSIGNLCNRHVCSSTQGGQCQNTRIGIDVATGETRELFCNNHSCFKCVEGREVPAAVADDDPPRNTCRKHPLCYESECREVQVRGQDYCDVHSVVPCQFCGDRSLARDIPYCAAHVEAFFDAPRPQTTAQQSSSNDLDENPTLTAAVQRNNAEKLCLGKNKRGNPCGSRAVPCSDYCHAHAPAEASFTQLQDEGSAQTSTMKSPASSEDPSTEITDAESSSTTDVKSSSAQQGSWCRGEEKSDGNTSSAERSRGHESQQRLVEGEAHEADEDSTTQVCMLPSGLLDAADAPSYDNPDEVEETDGVQHLREIIGEAEYDEFANVEFEEERKTSLSADESGHRIFGGASAGAHEIVCSLPKATNNPNPKEWTWQMNLHERWEACEDFMLEHKQQLETALALLKKQFLVERRNLQDATVRANARAYENKSVIFGTIVGCIGRLEAIRATNPFAILVEEASEVLEPHVYACIGCVCATRIAPAVFPSLSLDLSFFVRRVARRPSTVKLQMIGDHLQLSPSLMQVREQISFCYIRY